MSFTSICTSKGKVDSGYFAVIRTPASLSPSISVSSEFKINFAAFFVPSKESVTEESPSFEEDSIVIASVEEASYEEASTGELPVTELSIVALSIGELSIGELSGEDSSNEVVPVEAVSLGEAFSKEIASF